jgi:hypothetical protein
MLTTSMLSRRERWTLAKTANPARQTTITTINKNGVFEGMDARGSRASFG